MIFNTRELLLGDLTFRVLDDATLMYMTLDVTNTALHQAVTQRYGNCVTMFGHYYIYTKDEKDASEEEILCYTSEKDFVRTAVQR